MTANCDKLLAYLAASPTPFHAVEQTLGQLLAAGYQRLDEGDIWKCERKGRYVVTRNDSSLIAFSLQAENLQQGIRMIGAHTDSPCLRIKPSAITTNNGYAKLALEVYGGALLNPWFDRDLSVAGRVTLQSKHGELQHRLVDFKKPIAFIPSLAIHLDRDVNDNRSINKQNHLPAVLCRLNGEAPDFKSLLLAQIKLQHKDSDADDVLAYELSLYDTQPPATVGLEDEFIASARLDNLLSCHAGLQALLQADSSSNSLLVVNDHEEVGSSSASGAEGPFLLSVLERLYGDAESMRRGISHSMMISADNAHGVHPNYADRHEPAHQPLINAGPVIKINNNQRYATNSETEAVFRQVCQQQELPCQTMVVRSDMGCGSTIGPITATKLGVRTIDIGVPQLGMHSIRELAGVQDQDTMVAALRGFLTLSTWPF